MAIKLLVPGRAGEDPSGQVWYQGRRGEYLSEGPRGMVWVIPADFAHVWLLTRNEAWSRGVLLGSRGYEHKEVRRGAWGFLTLLACQAYGEQVTHALTLLGVTGAPLSGMVRAIAQGWAERETPREVAALLVYEVNREWQEAV